MAKRLPIITSPDPILRKRTEDISATRLEDKAFQAFLDDMTRTMIEADGIGLAAIQVAEQINVAVINTDEGPLHLINPHITGYGKEKEAAVEGCLSVPGVAGTVRRAKRVDVRALDRRGQPLSFSAEDLFARVIQHEVDHLNGILFIDRADRIWQSDGKEKRQ